MAERHDLVHIGCNEFAGGIPVIFVLYLIDFLVRFIAFPVP